MGLLAQGDNARFELNTVFFRAARKVVFLPQPGGMGIDSKFLAGPMA